MAAEIWDKTTGEKHLNGLLAARSAAHRQRPPLHAHAGGLCCRSGALSSFDKLRLRLSPNPHPEPVEGGTSRTGEHSWACGLSRPESLMVKVLAR